MNNEEQSIPIRISVTQAGVLFGVSAKTIRQAIKNNELLYIVARGRYKINFESLIVWSQKSTRRHNQLQKTGIGQYVEKWRIRTKKYSPSEALAKMIVDKKLTQTGNQDNQPLNDNSLAKSVE